MHSIRMWSRNQVCTSGITVSSIESPAESCITICWYAASWLPNMNFFWMHLRISLWRHLWCSLDCPADVWSTYSLDSLKDFDFNIVHICPPDYWTVYFFNQRLLPDIWLCLRYWLFYSGRLVDLGLDLWFQDLDLVLLALLYSKSGFFSLWSIITSHLYRITHK